MNSLLMQYLRDESGATAVEYGIILALLAAAIIGSVERAGIRVIGLFESVATSLPDL